jgi:mRNA-degrading endonuclease RelE of RelBE toxin-antitoxin system
MTFKGKPVKVMITGDAKEEFERLNATVGEEISNGIITSDHHTLLNSIQQKIGFLKDNPEYGVHIPKDRIPKDYINCYDVNNLWKVNLSGAWRMIYTINGSEVEIIALILDIIDHQDYDKKFGYRKG